MFDLLYLDGDAISSAPLLERKDRLRALLSNAGAALQYSDHQIGRGPEFYARACELSIIAHNWTVFWSSARAAGQGSGPRCNTRDGLISKRS